jgi:UDP-glucose 4-epimerase
MAVLVTGGAGYIGSVAVELLRAQGERVVVLDNLSRGHRQTVPDEVPFYHGDVGTRALVARIAHEHEIESCIHFAALAYVGESVAQPRRYFENNVEQGIALLDALIESGVKRFIFSSTCATYGEPHYSPIDERHPQQPTNPYGWSKFFLERILQSYDAAYGMKFVALRYFNAAGATALLGEHHAPETHLIPNILAAAAGDILCVPIFGDDYPTPDGTAVRDYVQVIDLGGAHLRALDYLRAGGNSEFINLGSGTGHSVLDVIKAARQVTGRPIETRIEVRRAGDPSHLVAVADKARAVLGWEPRHTELAEIIRTAWEWQLAHPSGYVDR